MKNLLSENFFRLTKSLVTWIGIFLTIFFTIIGNSVYVGNDKAYIDEWFFSGIIFVNLIASAVLGLYFFRDCSNGTLRLKIATGNNRTTVFLSNFITSTGYYFVLTVVNIGTNLVMYQLTELSSMGFNQKAACAGIAFMFFIAVSSAAITTLIGMSLQTVLCAIVPVLLNMVMYIIVIFISSDKDAPIVKFITEALPFGQTNYLSCITIPSRYNLMLLYTTIVIAVVLFTGNIIFKKLDLK